MITKERLLEFIKQYNPGLGRKLGFKSSSSSEMANLKIFVNELPPGLLNSQNIIKLNSLLITAEEKSETLRIFNNIKKELDTFFLLNIWTGSYYFDRVYSLVAAFNEIVPRLSHRKTVLSAHAFAILYLAFSYYSAKRSQYLYFFSGKLSQFLGQSISRNATNPLVNSVVSLGLQISFDFATGAGGLLIVSYLVGTIFESIANRLYDTIETNQLIGNYANKYPLSFSALKKVFADIGFGAGAWIGHQTYPSVKNYFTAPTTNKNTSGSSSHNEYDSKKDENQKPTSSSNEHSSANENQKCTPIILTDHEKELLENDRTCRFDFSTCRKTALKVLGLNPEDLYSPNKNKIINRAYKTLSLFCHPDRPGGNGAYMSLINSAHAILTPK